MPIAELFLWLFSYHPKLFFICRLNLLTWDGIPNDEIWIKLGGDKGGRSFKLAVQVANLPHPNSRTNTIMVAVFQASDSTFNLDLALKDFASDVELLMKTTWRYKYISNTF